MSGRFGGDWANPLQGHAIAALPRSAMKLRRLMQMARRGQKPTKAQRCASQQNWPADVADGSFTSFRFAPRAEIIQRLGPWSHPAIFMISSVARMIQHSFSPAKAQAASFLSSN
jgi:hypothetical protein